MELQDKDKLILVFIVGVKGLSARKSKENLLILGEHFGKWFDNSVKIIILPDGSNKFGYLDIKELNKDLLTPDKMFALFEEAKKVIETFTENTNKK